MISDDELNIAINKVKSDAVGLDGLPLSFIKLLLPVIDTTITHIFNESLMSSTFPDAWKLAMVIPVAKTARSNSCEEYRPISILPAISKALEIVMKDQMMDHINIYSLLHEHQSGFRHRHSGPTAVLQVTHSVRQAFENHHDTVLVLLDFSKAFDNVNHKQLCSKLGNWFKFSESAVALVANYLCHRFQRVSIYDVSSQMLPVTTGVPQGSVLGPLLFSIFINDLPTVLQKSKCHLYADDVQLFASRDRNDSNQLIDDINLDLAAVSHWSQLNNLTLNASKTQAIVFSNCHRNRQPSRPVILNGVVIPLSESVKDLGIVIARNLSWNENADHISAKVFAGLRGLWPHQRNLPIKTRINLVKTLLMPHFCYGSVVFAKMSAAAERTILRAFKACVRFVAGLKRYESTSDRQHDILGCGLLQYLDYRTCLFMFTLLQYRQPNYLISNIVSGTSARTEALILPIHRTASMNSSFFVNGVSTWNSLPLAIRQCQSVQSFKTHCRSHFSIT